MELKVYRFVFILISVCVIASSSGPVDKTLFIFSAGLLYDYWSVYDVAKEQPARYRNPWAKIVGVAGIVISLFFLLATIGCYQQYIKIVTINYSAMVNVFDWSTCYLSSHVLHIYTFLAGMEACLEFERTSKSNLTV